MDLETGHYILAHSENIIQEDEDADLDDVQFATKMKRALSEGNLQVNLQEHKILSFCQKAPKAKEGDYNKILIYGKFFSFLYLYCSKA
jgi:hypothetical protein